MSINNFIPAVWSAQILTDLRKSMVYGNLINRDYEGDIAAYGDQVKINSLGDITIGNYVKNTNMAAPEDLTDAQRILVIDQSKYFNFQIDDIDRRQQNPKVMSAATSKAAYALADVADQFVAGLYTTIAAGNTLGTEATPIEIKVDTATGFQSAYDALVDLGVKLTEANVGTAGRWAVIPPWMYGMILKDERFISAGTAKTDSVLMSGIVGEAAGFTIYQSNNVPHTGAAKYKIIVGTNDGWSFADQISEVEAYRPELRFADALKGLHLYGGKVIRPTGLALLIANKAE